MNTSLIDDLNLKPLAKTLFVSCFLLDRSVGCILYELCALEHAFSGQGLMGVMYRIVEGEPPELPRKYSRELAAVFKRFGV